VAGNVGPFGRAIRQFGKSVTAGAGAPSAVRNRPELQPPRAPSQMGFCLDRTVVVTLAAFSRGPTPLATGARDPRGTPNPPGFVATGREAVQHREARIFA
jgi:hypothetical protein